MAATMASTIPFRSNTNSSSTSGSATSRNHHPSYSSISQPSSVQSHHSLQQPSFHPTSHPRSVPPPLHSAPSPGRRTKPVKSQYPSDSGEKHVEYILVASFDIDRGSVMEHQYPAPVGGDAHMLAELMLPDQAHVRAQDWTIFFLHKDAAAEEDDANRGSNGRRRRRRRKDGGGHAGGGAEVEEEWEEYEADEDDSDDERDPIDGPPLVYVLNLVNMKHDTTVKRGAVVKAMAICTRHPFLHIYKPLLLLALNEYFTTPGMETLATLYDAVNAMDLSLMPRLSLYEKFILQSSDAKDLFLEKFEAIIAQRMAAKEPESTNFSHPSPTAATAQAAPARGRFGLPRDTHEFESVVKYANVPVPVKVPVALSPETVGDFSLIKLITTFATPHSTTPQPFNPTHPHLTTSGALTHPIIVLLNALLTQKRVIFLGHNLPSSEVAEAVLAACALASGGLLRGFTRFAFPYTDLTKIDDLLNVPGFIAGVTNPAFALKTEWWDLLCDLPTGRMKISNRIAQMPLSEGIAFFQSPQNLQNMMGGPSGAVSPGAVAASAHGISALVGAGASLSAGLGGNVSANMHGSDATGDGAFMTNVMLAIQERHGENAIRSKFKRWVLKFTRIAAAFEESVYGATSLEVHNSPTTPNPDDETMNAPEVQGHGYVWPTPMAKTAELAANATRIEGWRQTRSYYTFIQDLASLYSLRQVKEVDLHHLHDKLAKLRWSADGSAHLYLAISRTVRDDKCVSQLLGVICAGTWDAPSPNSAGGESGATSQQQGLFYLAMGLFHPRIEVREAVAELLLRIREHEAGKHFWQGLGRFAKVAWERVVSAKEARLAPEHEGVGVGVGADVR